VAAPDDLRVPRLAVSTPGVVTIVSYGVAYYSYGVLIDPIRTSMGWSSAALGAIFSAVVVIGGAGGVAGGRLVDRLGTRPAFLLAGSIGAAAIAIASLQTSKRASWRSRSSTPAAAARSPRWASTTSPSLPRSAPQPVAPQRAVVWLSILGAFASPIFLPLTAALVNAVGWRDTLRVQAIIASIAFLTAATVNTTAHAHPRQRLRLRASPRDALTGAWRTPGFRRWVLASLISGAAVDVVLVYQVLIMISAGLPITAAATIAGLRGFAQLAGRLPLTRPVRNIRAKSHAKEEPTE
jgi:MFS family permease